MRNNGTIKDGAGRWPACLRVVRWARLGVRLPRLGVAMVCLAAVGLPASAAAALDTSFSGDGKLTTDFGAGNARVSEVVRQPDGKVVVAGLAHENLSSDFALARYNVDGSLDTSFAADGMVTTNFLGDDAARGIALGADGKLVVAGHSGASDLALARYNPDGTLDTHFSDDGKLTSDFGSSDAAEDVAIGADGKIVVSGFAATETAGDDFAVARFTSLGDLDTSFSEDGRETVDLGGHDASESVVLQPDGKIVAVGRTARQDDWDFAVVRLGADGALDPTFSGDGVHTPTITSFDQAEDAALDADGNIVYAGWTSDGGHSDFVLVRHLPDGSLDPTFSDDGKVRTHLDVSDVVGGMGITQDGKIVVAGGTGPTATSRSFAAARYTSAGSLDTTFSGDGVETTDFGGAYATAADVTVGPDGRPTVAGAHRQADEADFALARYESANAATADTKIGAGGPQRVTLGDRFAYDLTITNEGPDTAREVVVRDDLPDGVVYEDSRSDPRCGENAATPDDNDVECSLGDVAPRAATSVRIGVSATRGGVLTNSASVASSTDDPDSDDNVSAPVTTEVGVSADLALDKSAPRDVVEGQAFDYVLSVSNSGPGGAPDVVVTDPLPRGATFLAAGSDARCRYDEIDHTVSCDLDALAPEGRDQVVIRVRAATRDMLLNRGTVSTSAVDSDPSDNEDSVETFVRYDADLSLSSTSPTSVRAGQGFSYTLAVANAGPQTARETTLYVTLTDGQSFVATSQGCELSQSEMIVCRLGELRSGATRTMGVTVETSDPTNVGVSASVQAQTVDGDPSNNGISRRTRVEPRGDTPTPVCTVVGGTGDDVIVASRGRDVICAGPGDDLVRAMGGDDRVIGGAGEDVLRGEAGNDRLLGGAGRDSLHTVDLVVGNDEMDGGTDSDVCRGDSRDSRRNCP